jgi:hypothetical protein
LYITVYDQDLPSDDFEKKSEDDFDENKVNQDDGKYF